MKRKNALEPADIAGWESLIADLETRLAGIETQLAAVKADRKSLALSIALGDHASQQQAADLERDIVRLKSEVGNLGEALVQARNGLQAAQEAARATRERERQERLVAALERRRVAAGKVDVALEHMASSIADWLDCADPIVEQGGDGHAKQLRGQLGSAIWHALGQSGISRVESWRYRTVADNFSGESRPSPARWRPLADQP